MHRAVDRVSLTGRIGRPLITIHGTLDVLVPISRASDLYAAMVKRSGRGDRHRYFRIGGGTHTDGRVALQPTLVCPMQGCFQEALDAMVRWTRYGTSPPHVCPPHRLGLDPADAFPVSPILLLVD
ncbi:3-hydroxybutyrate oligomer hydrolase family protein [Micromonospora deserti]|uniref:3-hydroxybutyrate oligomer hydrolase family protein n=1 Tax=Micromonospora deserti TaxID=2070366 RepID=UPI000DA84B37|nr:3-hydroxybutyrate oligomer hydrolase family protein [Micromonospora deserti]